MATEHQHHHGSHGEEGGAPINHETTDISLENVGRLAIGFSLVLLVVLGVMYGSFRLLDRRANAADVTRQRAIAAGRDPGTAPIAGLVDAPNAADTVGRPVGGPKLLTDEPLWLADIRSQQRQVLTSYAWIDKDAGTVRLPIERAKQLIVERGLPTTAAPVDPDAEAPAEGTEAAAAATSSDPPQ